MELSKGLKKEETLLLNKVKDRDVILITPIMDKSAQQGTLIVDISIESINRKFLLKQHSGEKGYAWMMDQSGILLYHPTKPKMVGNDLHKADFSCLECHESFEVEKKILDTGATGVHSYIAPYGEDKIIAFSKITLSPDDFWIALVSIPYSEVTASITKSMKLHSFLVIAIFLATTTGALFILVINKRRIKAEESVKHKAELQRYADELEKAVEKRTLELISEKDKLDTIVSSMDSGIFLADRDKNIIWANKALKDWIGADKIKELDLDSIYGGTELSSTVEDSMIQEVFHHTLGKRKGYFHITSSPLVGPDGNMQLLGLIHDVTEIKEFEEQMAHSEKLSSLGRLTAGIAHEIGNPLTSVFSFLQILREMEKDAFKKESLDTILFHINRIADTVRQLLGLSKLPPTELKEVQVNGIIESSIGLLQYDKRADKITVSKELPPLPVIFTDGNSLSQVFVNLLLNAVDAMPDGGILSIRSSNTYGNIVTEIEDTGIGIAAENLQRVFDPFFTTKETGTGLGLSVSYGIMKKLGGNISVKSTLGKGSVFTLTIPMERLEYE
jgi:signal transduction histidine kinase